MNAESWVRLSRLLDEALDLPSSERVPWLAALGPEDEALKPRLLALLAHAPSVQAADFLGTLPNVDVGAIDLPEESADHRRNVSRSCTRCCASWAKAAWARCGSPTGRTAWSSATWR